MHRYSVTPHMLSYLPHASLDVYAYYVLTVVKIFLGFGRNSCETYLFMEPCSALLSYLVL